MIDKSNGNQLRKMSHIMKPLINFGHLIIESTESPKILGQSITYLPESPSILGHINENDCSSNVVGHFDEQTHNSVEQKSAKKKMSELRSPNEFRRFLNP